MAGNTLNPHSSTTQIAEAAPTMAILPIGSCEQHGPHLPIGTDAMTATWLADSVSRELGALRLPTLAYGTSAEHRGFAGTVSLGAETLAAVVRDIADAVADSGIKRLAVISGHGGNWILKPTVRAINAQHPGRTVGLVPEPVIWQDSFADDLHAGATETSIVMHLAPTAVGAFPADFVPDVPREALDLLPMSQLTPEGIWGSPSRASAEQGGKILTEMADRVATYLAATFTMFAKQREEESQ